MPKGKAGMNLPKHFGFHTEKNFHFWEQSDKERFTENTHNVVTVTGTPAQNEKHLEVHCLTAKDGHSVENHPLFGQYQNKFRWVGMIAKKGKDGKVFKETVYFTEYKH
ncbi:hypothetical protein KJ891_00400 [Candidatus Micrarchaeota archaeon]|nr:hypothetical protein [Candidatus Micrarchaeota archaeon]